MSAQTLKPSELKELSDSSISVVIYRVSRTTYKLVYDMPGGGSDDFHFRARSHARLKHACEQYDNVVLHQD